MFAFYDDSSCLNQGQICVYIKLHGLQKELNQKVDVSDILNNNEIIHIKANNTEKLCKKIFDKLLIFEENDIKIDKNIQSMSDVIEQLKKEKFQAFIDEEDILENELEPKSV